MRVAVDDAKAGERPPPGLEQAERDRVARRRLGALEARHRLAFEPFLGQQPARRKRLEHARRSHPRSVGEHRAIEPRQLGLALVVELLAQARGDLNRDLAGVDRRSHPAVELQQEFELADVDFDRRRHVRVLQLAGEAFAGEADGAMDLAERGGGGRREVEFGEARAPVGAELGLHAPAHEGRAHRRRLRLQTDELFGVIGGQGLGDGRHHLRDLHQRPLERAERLREVARGVGALAADQPPRAGARREGAGADAEIGVAPRPRGKAVRLFVLRHSLLDRPRRRTPPAVAGLLR